MFELKAVDLGPLKKVLVGHSSEGKGQGWLCEQVTVTAADDPDLMSVFPCHKWLDTGLGDRK